MKGIIFMLLHPNHTKEFFVIYIYAVYVSQFSKEYMLNIFLFQNKTVAHLLVKRSFLKISLIKQIIIIIVRW